MGVDIVKQPTTTMDDRAHHPFREYIRKKYQIKVSNATMGCPSGVYVWETL